MEATKPNETPMIYKAIGAIMQQMPSVGKNGYNQKQGFKFRSIEDVCNAAHSLLAQHGVFCAPVCATSQVQNRELSEGKRIMHAVLTMKYTFYAADGSNVEVVTVGEGMDYGDKACNKAMSAAYKYALLQLFCIPTEDDGDYDDPASGPAAPAPPPPADSEKVTNEDRRLLIAAVTMRLQGEGMLHDKGWPVKLIQKVVAAELEGRTTIDTKDELERVRSAILNSGRYALDSGELVAA